MFLFNNTFHLLVKTPTLSLAPKDTPGHQPCIWPGGSNPETRWPRSQRPHLWVSISQEHVALEGQFPHHTHCTLPCAGPRPDWASISTLPQLSCDCASTPLTVGRGTHTHTHTRTLAHTPAPGDTLAPLSVSLCVQSGPDLTPGSKMLNLVRTKKK